MNTLSRGLPILPQEKSVVLFDDKGIDFGMPLWQYKKIIKLWKEGKSVHYIALNVERNPHEVFLALYQAWMERKIKDIGTAFSGGNALLKPGRVS